MIFFKTTFPLWKLDEIGRNMFQRCIKLGTFDLEKYEIPEVGAGNSCSYNGSGGELRRRSHPLDSTLSAEWMYGQRVSNSGVLVRWDAEFSQLFHVSVRIMKKIEKTIKNPGDTDRIVECFVIDSIYQ